MSRALEAPRPPSGTLSLGEAAASLRIPRQALLRMRNGEGPSPIGGDRGEPRYDVEELEDWAAAHEILRDTHGNVLRIVDRKPERPVLARLPLRAEVRIERAAPDGSLVAVWKAAERYRLAVKIGEGVEQARVALWDALDACPGSVR